MGEDRPTNLWAAVREQLAKLVILAFVMVPVVAGCSPVAATPYEPDSNASGAQQDGTGATTGAGNYPNVGTGAGAGTPGTGGAGAQSGGGEWCAVQTILQNDCQLCHGASPSFGAPMSLVTHDDLLAAAPGDGRPVYEVMLDRVTSLDKPMPPPPGQSLADADIATLQAWVDAGAPAADCSTTSTPGGGGTGSVSASGGAGNATSSGGAWSSGGAGGASSDCIDCGDYECTDGYAVQLLAHGNPVPGDTTPFDASQVGADGNPNLYQCYYFKANWSDATQLIGHKPVIDNSRVLHHWLLYASNTPPVGLTDGGLASHCEFQPDQNRELLAGWAPGSPGNNMPADVGQELPDGTDVIITLEIHYFNTDPGTPAPDRSGVEVCLTDTPRPNEATMHWLGTENITVPPNAQATAGDTCTPNTGETSTILAVWPHEHLTGVHTKLELFHADGTSEIVHDGAFDFNNQTIYWLPSPMVVSPGDHLQATCTYQNNSANTVFFGAGSQDEMCYLFTLAYPAGSLYNGKDGCVPGVGCVPGGTNRCIDNENILTAIGGLDG